MTTSLPLFIRDRFTWLAYFMLAYFAYTQAAMGPLIPFLRDELRLNYTLSGLHLSAFAVGMIAAGSTADRVARRIGRAATWWGGGAGMALGAILLTLGQHPIMTIGSALLMGFIGSYLLVMVQATLADRHGANRAFALTESNVFASLSAMLAPLAVGAGQSSGIGWRLVLYLSAASWALATIFNRQVRLPVDPTLLPPPRKHGGGEQPQVSTSQAHRLPKAFWAYWLVVFISVSVEWCMIFWAADFLEKIAGMSKESAAASVSLFFLANVIGRASGSLLTRRFASGGLLMLAGALVVLGFPAFWLGRTTPVNLAGLFVCGLGVANLFPLTLTSASAVGMANPNAASARISMGAGLAILITPQLLGSAADQVGIQTAYAIVAPLALAIIAVTAYAHRLTQHNSVETAGPSG